MGDGRCLTSRDTLLQIVKLLLSQRYQLTLRKERKLSRVQLFATPCDPLPGSSVHGIFQARILEWIAISFSRGFSQLRDQTHVSGNGLRHLGSPKKQESPSIPSCPSHLQDTASWQLDIKHQYPGDASPTDLHRTPDIPGEIRAERN